MEKATLTQPVFKRAKILATIGPATHSGEAIEELIEAGVNGFRLNFSHGTDEEMAQNITWIRQASEAAGKPVTILQDLQGLKIRLGDIDGKLHVAKDEEWQLAYAQATAAPERRLEVQYDLSAKMKTGERLFMFDGKIEAEVIAVDQAQKTVTARIHNDGVLTARKGLNVPDTDFGGDVLTEKDRRDVAFGAAQDIDYVAMSFVQTADDVEALRRLLREHKSTAKVIAKIETMAAIEERHLEDIIKASDGIMIARGDLAVEAGAEVVPVVQRNIIGLCQKHGRLSIVATQMMASMTDAPSPTRAEVSDVAQAVVTGADCLMLSDETAVGKYPVETVKAMKRTIVYTQEHAPLRPVYVHESIAGKQDAISLAAVTLAGQINATAIIAETKSGATARSLAACRPGMPLISVTSDTRVAQQLGILYANKSFLRDDGERAGLELAYELSEKEAIPIGSTVVIVSGRQPGVTGTTDTIRVRVLE